MSSRITTAILCLSFLWVVAGCRTAGKHSSQLHSAQDQRLTVGVVQKEIRKGMSGADVAAALGSPNIVSRDSGGMETWIYDKIATEASYSNDAGGIGGVAGGGGMTGGQTLILGGLATGYGKSAGASATTQRTLTVIIKFDEASRVSDFSYHSSRF